MGGKTTSDADDDDGTDAGEDGFLDERTATETGIGFESTLVPGDVAPPGKELRPGTQVGGYEIENKLGEGAMGIVYRAVHPTIGRHVAIKVISARVLDEPGAVARFTAEARAVARIRHPNIVQVFGFGQLPDGRTYLTMELLDGDNLGVRLARGDLGLDEALYVIREIARALEAAHASGVVHRDLKPENVFVQRVDDELPSVKLLDFGIAKTSAGNLAVTKTGQILGTPHYMSPEQCRSKGVDHRTDIYALGCLAFQMVTGHLPFDFDNIADLMSAHLHVEPPRARTYVPHLSVELDALLVRMMAKQPDARPTLAEVRQAVQNQNRRSQGMAAVVEPEATSAPAASAEAAAVAVPIAAPIEVPIAVPRARASKAVPVPVPASVEPTEPIDPTDPGEPPERPSGMLVDDTTLRLTDGELDDTALTMGRLSFDSIAPAEPASRDARARLRMLVIALVIAVLGVGAAIAIYAIG